VTLKLIPTSLATPWMTTLFKLVNLKSEKILVEISNSSIDLCPRSLQKEKGFTTSPGIWSRIRHKAEGPALKTAIDYRKKELTCPPTLCSRQVLTKEPAKPMASKLLSLADLERFLCKLSHPKRWIGLSDLS
jgi:hypothetical protein